MLERLGRPLPLAWEEQCRLFDTLAGSDVINIA